jgi:predicted  nucleic acid-binding Zn-ribbon protein
MLAGVDKEMLHRYERILQAKDDGVAMAPVIMYESIEDEGAVKYWGCGGCSVGVTSQDVNELRRGREIVLCRSCSRILYWKA